MMRDQPCNEQKKPHQDGMKEEALKLKAKKKKKNEKKRP
jgi:hypothetical protein